MAVFLCRIVLLSVSAIFSCCFFSGPAEAWSKADKNRALLLYNTASDYCRQITESSGVTAKTAADKSCEQAFEALDRIELNTCQEWRSAECRLLNNDPNRQCTCVTYSRDDVAVRAPVIRPFRDCAAALWNQKLGAGVEPAPTADFQQLRGYYDDSWELARIRRSLLNPGQYDGGSSRPHISGGAGTLEGIGTSGGAGSSVGGYSPHEADIFRDFYNQFGSSSSASGVPFQGFSLNPSEAYPSYAQTRPGHVANSAQSEVMPYTCPICSMICNSLYDFGEHMKTHPTSDVPPKSTRKIKDSGPSRHVCDKCGRSYNLRRTLLAHQRSHKTLDTYCVFCQRTLVSKPSYQNHMRRRHPEFVRNQSAAVKSGPTTRIHETENRFVCKECGKSYAQKKFLKSHEKRHNSLETYCTGCKRFFASKYSYWEHMERTHPELAAVEKAEARAQRQEGKTDVCEVCGKGFKPGGRGLLDHQKVHQGATECDLCGKSFARISVLNIHKKKCSQKKPNI